MHNEAVQGHYLLHISFSSGIFSKACEGGRPLPLYHYSPNEKKVGSWTREATLPVKEVKSGGKCTGILGSETSLDVVQFTEYNKSHVNQQHRCVQSARSIKYTIMASEMDLKKACGRGMRN